MRFSLSKKKQLFILLLLFPRCLSAFDLTQYKTIISKEQDGSQSELKFYRYQNDTYSVHFENNGNNMYEIYMMKAHKDKFFTVGVSADKDFASLDKMMKFYVLNGFFYVEWQLRSGRVCKKEYQIVHREKGILYCRLKATFYPQPPNPHDKFRRR